MLSTPHKRCINHAMRGLFACLQQAGADWYRQDFPLIAYLFKYLLAAFLALWLALKMEMDQPATALLTVVIVMHFRSGMVITKSYYRLIGTVIGILFSMLLVASFAQDRFPFFMAAALWIGLCTAGSLVTRNFQSYGFVLAGYTLCIVGLPATLTPWHTFQIASTRLSEIGVGLLSATLLSELILPQRLWENIQAVVRGKFRDFSLLMGAGAPAGLNQPFLKFMQDLYQLESFRASAQFETDEARWHGTTINQLNMQFMAVSTTYVVFQRLVQRLLRLGQRPEAEALMALMQPLSEAILIDGHPANDVKELARLQQAVTAYLQGFDLLHRQQLHALATVPRVNTLEVETGAELLQRLATELAAYLNTYVLLVAPLSLRQSNDRAWNAETAHMQIDWLPVAIAGVRGALTLLLLGAIWITLDWPSGILAMTLGVITSTLFAGSPAPMATLRQFSAGVVLGIALVYVSNVFWLTAAHDYVMLCIVIAPAILLTAWLSARPATALVGAGLGIAYFLMVGFNQALGDNPVKYFNDSIALMIALGVSGILFTLTDYTASPWANTRVFAQLRQLVVDACLDPGLTSTAFEMRARDLIQRSGNIHRPHEAERVRMVEALCATLEIGHAVMALRTLSSGLAAQAQRLLQHTLVLIAHDYKRPRSKSQQQVLQWLDHFLAWVQGGEYADALTPSQAQKLITQLHFIRLVIAEETLANTPQLKEAAHAA